MTGTGISLLVWECVCVCVYKDLMGHFSSNAFLQNEVARSKW